MTKRDYELIARVLAYEAHLTKTGKQEYATDIVVISRIAAHLALRMGQENQAFKPGKFLIACGLGG